MDVFPLDSLCFLNRCHFNEVKGREMIERLALIKSLDSVMFGCAKKYYTFSAVSALFFFLEQELSMNFSSNSINFLVKPSDGTLSLGEFRYLFRYLFLLLFVCRLSYL